MSQGFSTSGTFNKEAGGELKFGSKLAELNGTGTVFMTGTHKGEVFGTLK